MRLGIGITLWGRPHLSEMMMRHTATLGVDRLVAVRSPEDPNPAPDVDGWDFIERPNYPLSEKWAAGVQALSDMDAVMILGSDDFVNAAFIEAVRQAIEDEGYDYVQPGGFWAYEPETMRCMYGEAFRIGAGRTLSRRLLDMVDWNPWPPSHIGKVDSAMDERLDPICFPHRMRGQLEERQIMVDVKTRENKWSYDNLCGLAHAVHHPIRFWNTHFPEIAEEILDL